MDVGDADKGLDALRQTRIHRAKPFWLLGDVSGQEVQEWHERRIVYRWRPPV